MSFGIPVNNEKKNINRGIKDKGVYMGTRPDQTLKKVLRLSVPLRILNLYIKTSYLSKKKANSIKFTNRFCGFSTVSLECLN